MGTRSTEWRPGPTVCRCCLNEGCYKDIATEYFWMGKREVYEEMLSETLDLTVSFSKSGGPNSNSRLICEACISRLRDAADFKRQVQECERTFMQYLDPGTSTIDIEVPEVALDIGVKVEQVKEEAPVSDDDDFGNQPDFPADDDEYEDIDDEPLTKLASKIPKEESVDVLELLDVTKTGKKRKTTIKLQSKTTPAKKAKTKKDVKPTSSKAKPEKKKKVEKYDPARSNAEILIKYTTAYPFRVNDKCILCVYCHELYDSPNIFRRHMDEEHGSFSIKLAFHSLPKLEFIKADLTNLRCRDCEEGFDNLENIAQHLKSAHNVPLDLNSKLGVMPYFLQEDSFSCAVCQKSVPSLLHLNRHTITHFLSYVCHVCGSSYVATTGLLRHVRSKHQDYEVQCKKCKKLFPNMEAKERHRRTEKSCMPYGCTKCSERFHDWKIRKRHMENEHGQSRKIYRCADCGITFDTGHAYYVHFKLKHSADCIVCKYCGLKFSSRSRMKRHLSKHTF